MGPAAALPVDGVLEAARYVGDLDVGGVWFAESKLWGLTT